MQLFYVLAVGTVVRGRNRDLLFYAMMICTLKGTCCALPNTRDTFCKRDLCSRFSLKINKQVYPLPPHSGVDLGRG